MASSPLTCKLGLKVFDRGGHAARLTDKGREFWQMARQLLRQRDAVFGTGLHSGHTVTDRTSPRTSAATTQRRKSGSMHKHAK
jgi:DNA-binding transcriptional LysR family regulator